MNDRMRLIVPLAVLVLGLILYALLCALFEEQNMRWVAGVFLASLDRVLGILLFLPRWLSWAVIVFFLAAGARFLLWENQKVSEGQRAAVAVTALVLLLLAAAVPLLLGLGRGSEKGVWWRPDTYRAAGTERLFDGISFVWVPAGHYLMGSPDTEPGRTVDESRAEVVFAKGFWVSRHEVTWRQYLKVMDKPPQMLSDARPDNQDLPVTGVSYDEALAFAETLSRAKKGGYRLPKESEWEYACRAVTTTRWSFGDDATQLPEYAWFNENSEKNPHPVGTRKPNPWGIYDMHGNAAEWCSQPNEAGKDAVCLYRGGNWEADAAQCRSAAKGLFLPGKTHLPRFVGIRLLLEP